MPLLDGVGGSPATPPDWAASPGHPLEMAQLVWERVLALGDAATATDLLGVVHLAGNNRSILEHALSLGRTQGSPAGSDAVHALERAIALVTVEVDARPE